MVISDRHRDFLLTGIERAIEFTLEWSANLEDRIDILRDNGLATLANVGELEEQMRETEAEIVELRHLLEEIKGKKSDT
jgi:TolA-binding protein